MKRCFLLWGAFFCCGLAWGQKEKPVVRLDTVQSDLLNRSLKRVSLPVQYAERTVKNPAMKYYSVDFSYTQMKAYGQGSEEDEAIVQQLGRAYDSYGLDIQSVLRPSDGVRAWGRAYYTNTTVRDISWNLTSDYDRVYPYNTVDTLAPAKQYGETYAFSGGYAKDMGRYLWGIEASTRNVQDYRTRDPRPRNRVSDIDLSIGLGRKLTIPYMLGLSTKLGAYKQAQTISALADDRNKISSPIYNMTGLGTSLFIMNDVKDFSYEAYKIAVAIDVYPENQKGFTANLEVLRDRMNKVIAGASSIYNVSRIQEKSVLARAGWIDVDQYRSWFMQGSFEHRNREGSEVIVANHAEDTGLITDKINAGMAPYYLENTTHLKAEGAFETGKRLKWRLQPSIRYSNSGTKYRYPERSLTWQRLQYQLQTHINWHTGNQLWSLLFSVYQDNSLDSNLDIDQVLPVTHGNTENSYKGMDRHSRAIEYANYRFIATNNTQLEVGIRAEWQLFNNKSIFLNPAYRAGWYTQQVKTSFWQISLGMAL